MGWMIEACLVMPSEEVGYGPHGDRRSSMKIVTAIIPRQSVYGPGSSVECRGEISEWRIALHVGSSHHNCSADRKSTRRTTVDLTMPIARFGSNAVRCFRPGDAGARCGTQRRVCSSAVRQAADKAREFPYTSRAAALETGSVPAGSIRKPSFPFSCISGQEALKLALLLNVVDPKIGGVLIMGDRGTGKSVSVRALAELLPDITVVTNDPFNSDPHDTNLMGPEALERRRAGEALEAENIRTPLVMPFSDRPWPVFDRTNVFFRSNCLWVQRKIGSVERLI